MWNYKTKKPVTGYATTTIHTILSLSPNSISISIKIITFWGKSGFHFPTLFYSISNGSSPKSINSITNFLDCFSSHLFSLHCPSSCSQHRPSSKSRSQLGKSLPLDNLILHPMKYIDDEISTHPWSNLLHMSTISFNL